MWNNFYFIFMIWIFDSGSWWLTFLNELKKILPENDLIYFWDYKNCPYGNKTSKEIFELTKAWVLKLKEAWAKIVILACNTATSNSIKKLQQDEKNLWIKVLGVTIPWAERVVEAGYKKISVIATNSSVKNKLYKTRVWIIDREVQVQEIWLENLAVLVEDFLDKKISSEIIEVYLKEKTKYVWGDSEAIILGCTHYSHIKNIFKELFKDKEIIDPSYEAAKKLKIYLEKHSEINNLLTKNSEIIYL